MTSWLPPPLPPRLAASRHVPLVGRRHELEVLESLWLEVEAGRRQLLFVGGEPGAGKTRFIAEAAGALHDNDVAVLIGTSSVDADIPYQPFAEMLDALFSTAAAGSLSSLIGQRGKELARLSAGVRRHRPDVLRAGTEGGDVRRDLFDAVAGLFRAMTAARPLALLLDDLQWAQAPTLALLEHVVQACPDTRMLVIAAFRTTAPDRSDEVVARVADLHRLEGVRRVDLSGLDIDAIAELLTLRGGLAPSGARTPAALLRDLTGGNPFFLRELLADLDRWGGVSALRSRGRVPASIRDTLTARLANLDENVQAVIEVAAVLGDTFDLATLIAASDTGPTHAMVAIDAAMASGLIEEAERERSSYSFVHALSRQTVLDRMPAARRTHLHARAGEALERQPPDASTVPRLARHYLAAQLLGYQDRALRYSREAGRLAERSLAFEDAAVWFERAASLPDCPSAERAALLLDAAAGYVRACEFPRARAIYERLTASAEPVVRLAAAMGFEDASWRPGLVGPHAGDLLSLALQDCELEDHDPRYVRALGSLGRALALAGETRRARDVGSRAIDLARLLDDDATLIHALTSSLWHGTTPDVADVQLERTADVYRLAKGRRDYETLGSAANFRAMVTYLRGLPDDLESAVNESLVSAQATGQSYYHYVAYCLANAMAFMRGDFAGAERWAEESRKQNWTFGDEMTDGPHGVQMFMIRRETGALERFRPYIDGHETFTGRWVPGLLALYTELGVEAGIKRALHALVDRDLTSRTDEAQWVMELVFLTEGALAVQDLDVVRTLRPLLAEYAGMNLFSGTLIATFGSADRLLGRVAALLGDDAAAERSFVAALEMDRRMRSPVHVAETLAHQALFAAANGQADRAGALAEQARAIAEPIGQTRVLRTLAMLRPAAGPDGLSDREVEVLRLLAGGLSNQEIGARLHISANTAANHIRRILMKTGAANRTQAATYAAQHQLV